MQKKGSIAIEKIEVDQTLDTQFKPGLYLQVKKFLGRDWDDFSTIEDLKRLFPTYLKMAGY